VLTEPVTTAAPAHRRAAGSRSWAARRAPWLAAAAVVAACTALGVRAVSDPSPWLHLRVARTLMDGQRFGSPDPWSPFASRAFLPTEWLPSLVAELGYQVAGLPFLAWLRCLGILALLLATTWSARAVAGRTLSLLCAGIAVAGAWPGLTERPQLVSFVLLALTVGAWWRTAADLRPRWWLVPLTFLWACSHGLWVIGIGVGIPVVLGLALDRRLDRRQALRLLAVPALSALAAAVTPLGPQLLLTPLTYRTNGSEFVQEWQATSPREPHAALVLLVVGAVVLLWARSGRRPGWWQLLLAVAAVAATLAMNRLVPVGAALAAPLLADALQQRTGRRPEPAHPKEWRGLIALILAALVVAAPVASHVAQQPTRVPLGLASQMHGIPAGSVVLDDDDLSGWLLWSQPQLVPVVDIRSEVYSAAWLHRYVAATTAAPGWREFVRDTGARYAVLRTDSPLTGALGARLGWRTLGQDRGYTLLEAP